MTRYGRKDLDKALGQDEPNYKYANFGRWVAGIAVAAAAIGTLIGAGCGVYYLGSQSAARDELRRLSKEGKITVPYHINHSQKCKVTNYVERQFLDILCEGDRNENGRSLNAPYYSSVEIHLEENPNGLIDRLQVTQTIPGIPKKRVEIGSNEYSVLELEAGKVETLYQSK